jgi:hypothetical protein
MVFLPVLPARFEEIQRLIYIPSVPEEFYHFSLKANGDPQEEFF